MEELLSGGKYQKRQKQSKRERVRRINRKKGFNKSKKVKEDQLVVEKTSAYLRMQCRIVLQRFIDNWRQTKEKTSNPWGMVLEKNAQGKLYAEEIWSVCLAKTEELKSFIKQLKKS